MKKIPGLQINLSAITKGYAADAMAQILREMHYENFMVEIGGEVIASGTTFEEKPWKIGIHQPETDASLKDAIYKRLSLTDMALATSGNYQNYFEYENKIYSHILDPRTGRPVASTVASVSVVARRGVLADAAATAVSVLGVEEGLSWIESQGDLEALILVRRHDNTLEEIMSSGFRQYLMNDGKT